jgi:surface glycoprotein (TIGR04207 family)
MATKTDDGVPLSQKLIALFFAALMIMSMFAAFALI